MSAVRKPKPTRQKSSDREASANAFLGVTQSARGFAWRERLDAARANTATAISQRYGLPEMLGRVLAARDVGIDEVTVFLDPALKALMPDPSTLQDMDKAAIRLADAIQKKQRVAVFGDYDVDGASSSALVHRFLASHGLGCRIYIPDRIFEGYGPNPTAIEALIKDGAQLIVTVDCGTTSFDALSHAKRLKTDVIIIDHHQADESLPDVHAVVNPNRQDDISGLGHLCAAGVVFLVLVATVRELRRRKHYTDATPAPDLLELLDIVALATVCDVVPLKSLNRAYVTRGLAIMKGRRNTGLRALFDASGLNQAPTPYHLGFVLGPRINAGGRIGDAALGSKLLSIDDETEAARIAVLLDKLNRERKTVETQMLEEAMAEADRLVDTNPDIPIVVVGSDTWHKGVVGLVSSRLTERFKRPSCVIAWGNAAQGTPPDEGTGSLRSVADVDIGGAVRAAVAAGHLKKGGGHAMAAGLTVARNKIEDLTAFLADQLQSSSSAARSQVGLEVDGALTPGAVTHDLMNLIDRAGPFGQGNPQPRFVFPAHRIKFVKVVGEAHVRCALEAGDGSRIDAIAFRAAGQPLGDLLVNSGGMPLHVAGSLRRDTWNGRDKLELFIEDAADPRQQG
jgi:single-stranded-DNA-specific exonuclease